MSDNRIVDSIMQNNADLRKENSELRQHQAELVRDIALWKDSASTQADIINGCKEVAEHHRQRAEAAELKLSYREEEIVILRDLVDLIEGAVIDHDWERIASAIDEHRIAQARADIKAGRTIGLDALLADAGLSRDDLSSDIEGHENDNTFLED